MLRLSTYLRLSGLGVNSKFTFTSSRFMTIESSSLFKIFKRVFQGDFGVVLNCKMVNQFKALEGVEPLMEPSQAIHGVARSHPQAGKLFKPSDLSKIIRKHWR